ncbi:hypothetical protein LCGC14_1516990 [marine sediment metagenome]|uniref:Uncharacterized protein n=1 Tax=marine sediment metagenome TaxID=412755 RepID=A0A0F9LFG1_9ZZZZ
MIRLKAMVNESQQELDDGCYDGDYDTFCFMKECYEYVEQLQDILEMKSFDLLLPGFGERKSVYCCSICGDKPHKDNCRYGQALRKEKAE